MGKRYSKHKKQEKTSFQPKGIVGLLLLILLLVFGGANTDQIHEIAENMGYEQTEDVTGTGATTQSHWYQSLPPYRGTPYAEVNHDIPFFSKKDKKRTDSFENYSELDSLGRCGTAYANICEELMPTNDRGDISRVKPSGWIQKKYKLNGKEKFIYNRSHLIAYSLAGENDNPLNLITGTDYFNHDGMIPFETTVRDYINDNPSRHVLYRVTPVFEGNDLVARGVLMEAWSVEDNGYGVQFCVFVYNVQPGIAMDYATGKTKKGK